jgi:hypothetical protein
VFGKILTNRPEILIRRTDYAATGEDQEKAGNVDIGADLAGGDGLPCDT